MNELSSRSWFDDLVDRLADRVKDAILDIDFDDEAPEELPPEPLPAVNRDLLTAAMRDRTEATLRAAAEVINDVQPGPGWEESQRHVAELFVELARETFATGLRLRTAAAVYRPAESVVGGLWAERYRRMRIMNAAFPEPAGTDDD
jgi:hypothetical protein